MAIVAIALCCHALGESLPEASPLPEFRSGTAREYLTNIIQIVQVQTVTTNKATLPDACFAQARVQSHLGEKEAAEYWARRGLRLASNRVDIQLFLADLLVRQDRMEEAAQTLRQALAAKPDLAGGQRQLGGVLDRLGDREGARKAFETAVQQAPRDATARLLLGRLLLDTGQPREALTNLQEACRLNPGLSGAFYALSEAQGQLGDDEGAKTSMQTFQRLKQREKTELDDQNLAYDDRKFMTALAAGFHIEAATLLLAQKQPGLAETHLRQALRISPDELPAHEALATLLRQAGRLTEARTCYESLVRLQPNQAASHLNLGTLLLELKDYPAAVQAMKAALAIDPKQPQALGNLARFYLANRRELPKALELTRRLVEARPVAANYDLLGWALFANGQTNEARAAARQAVDLEPTNTGYRARFERLRALP